MVEILPPERESRITRPLYSISHVNEWYHNNTPYYQPDNPDAGIGDCLI